MATTINQGMKDVDCVRLSGEKIIAEAYKAYQQKECELEKVKQAVCREFEIKVLSSYSILFWLVAQNICIWQTIYKIIKINYYKTLLHFYIFEIPTPRDSPNNGISQVLLLVLKFTNASGQQDAVNTIPN